MEYAFNFVFDIKHKCTQLLGKWVYWK